RWAASRGVCFSAHQLASGICASGSRHDRGIDSIHHGKRLLNPTLDRIASVKHDRSSGPAQTSRTLTTPERKRVGAIGILLVFAAVFWAAYEQVGSTLNLFADRYVRLNVFSLSFPSTWFQALPSLMVIVFAPIFAWLWIWLGKHSPSSPTKFGFGLLFAAFAFVLLVPAGILSQHGVRVSSWWLVGFYSLLEFGELCLSPVGLSLVTKLAPAKLAGSLMGI